MYDKGMEILFFFLAVLLLGVLALDLGVDSRPTEPDHHHNW
jgi:hypothetical protein